MHIWLDKRPEAGRRDDFRARTMGAGMLLVMLVGCASPGPPLPPSLKLPAIIAAKDLTAIRVGNTVALHWTTPTHTTDKLLINGPITAVVCRSSPSAAPAAVPAQPASAKTACVEAERLPVTPGSSDAVDILPAALTVGPPRLLVYRVELLNSAGRTAGPSPVVYAVAGATEPALADFRGHSTKAGVVLEWKREPAAASPNPTDPDRLQEAVSDILQTTVELTRTTVKAPAAATPTSAPKAGLPTGLPGTGKEPTVTRFQAGNTDAGGALDRTAQIGRTYIYTAQRVRSAMVINNQTLELRSAQSATVTIPVRDVFPPEVPVGLVAVPGFAGEGETQKVAIDLSWEPDIEPRLAGYRVYRREGDSGAWQRLGAELIPVAAYRDAAVIAGHIYTYRVTAVNGVTAVSDAGDESAPSAEITETAPAQ